MFGIKTKINSTVIDNRAVGQLRGLGLSPVEAGKKVSTVRSRFKQRKLTHTDTAVSELPKLIAAGVMEPEATLCAAAKLASLAGEDLSPVLTIIRRVGAQGKVKPRDLMFLESRGWPLAHMIEAVSGQPAAQVDRRAEHGDIDALEFFDAIRIVAKEADQ